LGASKRKQFELRTGGQTEASGKEIKEVGRVLKFEKKGNQKAVFPRETPGGGEDRRGTYDNKFE